MKNPTNTYFKRSDPFVFQLIKESQIKDTVRVGAWEG